MKNILLAVALLSSIAFVRCNDDDLADIKTQVTVLQDSLRSVMDQHNALLDSVSTIIETLNRDETDIKALKMAQISSLFEAIARQPEAYENLIAATEMLYTDYTQLLPFSDSTITARGYAINALFDGIARQPEAFHALDSAATKYLGEFNPSYINDDISVGKARGIALTGLFESIARQPAAFHDLDSVATKYIGKYDPSYISDETLEASKALALAGLNESLARQPAADSLFNLVCITYLNFHFIDYPDN